MIFTEFMQHAYLMWLILTCISIVSMVFATLTASEVAERELQKLDRKEGGGHKRNYTG